MTKQWESYAQLTSLAGLQPVVQEQSYQGMSDLEEIMRSGTGQGIGEVLVDYDSDARELGLI